MIKLKLHFYFFALAALGKGLSGGDRIYIELAKRWGEKFPIDLFVWNEGKEMAVREGLTGKEVKFYTSNLLFWKSLGFVPLYFARIILGVWLGIKLKVENSKNAVIYAASDFWMDSIPAILLKIRFRKIILVGTYYLSAPNPFIGFRESGSWGLPSLKSCIYFFQQQPTYWLLRKYADIIFVTSQPDAKKFPKQESAGNVFAIRGGVDMENVERWRKKLGKVSKKYDAIFMGRFHPQKGVLELVDIWKKVVEEKPNATLVMIGDGPLYESVKEKIKKLNLENKIFLEGYLFDGKEKYQLFSQSRIVVHPAIYDSGGMAAAEAMAWGLPGISFDLEALKTYYPKGMIKVQIGKIDDFSNKIISLLNNKKLYSKISKDAKELIHRNWQWNAQAKKAMEVINNKMHD